MKNKQLIKTLIPITLLMGIFIASIMAILSGPQANASTNESTATFSPSSAAISMNLWIEGISGESKIAGREGSIDIIAFSHNIKVGYDTGAARIETAEHAPIRFIKTIDKATPKLYEACSKGTKYPVTFTCFYEPNALDYYTIQLTGAMAVSVQNYGTVEFGDVPMEQVSFIYDTIKWIYTEYDEQGQAKGNVEYQDTWPSASEPT
ncbi:MAG: Hcp family type VI secretion system effector [Promethearchaeota archaeon]